MGRGVLALVIDFRDSRSGEATGAEPLTRQLARPGTTVVHVDNGSPVRIQLTPDQREAGVVLMRHARNDGYAGGIVEALKVLDPKGENYDYYWFLNSDLEVADDCLDLLLARFEAAPRLAAVGPRVYLGRDRSRVWGARGVIRPGLGVTAMEDWSSSAALPRWSYIPGSSLLVRAAAYWAVGGLSTRYRMYYEETELCVELQKAAWELAVVPAAAAFHFHQSMADRIPARHFAFYFARNNLYFWRRNFGIPPWAQFPRTLFVALKELVLPLRRATSLRVAGERLGLVLAGLWDGWQFLRVGTTFWERRLFSR